MTVLPVSPPQGRLLSSSPFILWRQERMTQDEDEKRQARRAGGLRAAHGQMKGEQNNCNLFSRPEEQEEVEALWGLPRVPE